jgi:hypothetical protein
MTSSLRSGDRFDNDVQGRANWVRLESGIFTATSCSAERQWRYLAIPVQELTATSISRRINILSSAPSPWAIMTAVRTCEMNRARARGDVVGCSHM